MRHHHPLSCCESLHLHHHPPQQGWLVRWYHPLILGHAHHSRNPLSVALLPQWSPALLDTHLRTAYHPVWKKSYVTGCTLDISVSFLWPLDWTKVSSKNTFKREKMHRENISKNGEWGVVIRRKSNTSASEGADLLALTSLAPLSVNSWPA